MMIRLLAFLTIFGLLSGCKLPESKTSAPSSARSVKTLADFQKRAARFNSLIHLPQFETTPEAIATSITNTIKLANAALDQVGRLDPKKVTFENTILALDNLSYQANQTANRLELLKETSTNAAVRDAATD